MTDALTVAKQAVALWRKYRGSESTYLQCQRFDGWYWQAAANGEAGIIAYPTAKAAYEASPIHTRDINSEQIEAGDNLFYAYGSKGHVVTAIGRQNGRTLVTDTSNSGTALMSLGVNVTVKYADTISLPFLGASHTNGRNKRRSGVTPHVSGSTASVTPTTPVSNLEVPMAVYVRAKGAKEIYEVTAGKKYHVSSQAWKAVTTAFAAAGAKVSYSKEKLSQAEVAAIPNG